MSNDNRFSVTDAEMPIMQSLWRQGEVTSPEIFQTLSGNNNTLKTLLLRLVQKGAVHTREVNLRHYRYRAAYSEEDYIANQRESFLQRVFGGSTERMLLNFVKGGKISPEAVKRLMDMAEEE